MGITKISALLCIALPVSAAVKYWDINGATPGAGGANPTGIWDAATANWSVSPLGDAATVVFSSGDAAVFSAGTDASGSYTINNAGLVSPSGGIIVRNGTVTLAGSGSIAIAAGTVMVTNGATLVYGVSSKFVVSSGNALVLDKGGVKITNALGTALWNATGDLRIGPGGGTIEVTAGGVAVYTGANGISLTPGTTSAALTKLGAGEFRPQTCAFTRLVINQGLWRIPGTGAETGFGAVPAVFTPDALAIDGGAVGTSANLVTTVTRGITLGNAGATFVISAPWTIHSAIAGPGRLAVNGNGFAGSPSQVLTLDGTNSYQGGTAINLGVLSVGADSNLGAVPVAPESNSLTFGGGTLNINHSFTLHSNRGIRLTTNAVIDVSPGQQLVVGGEISANSASFALTKISTGTLSLSGSNAFGGGVGGDFIITGGMVTFENDHAAGKGTIVVSPASPVTLRTSSMSTTLSNALILNAGPVTDIQVDAGSTLALSGFISGAGALIKDGAGTVTFGGSNNYGGGTTITAGTLQVEDATGSATGPSQVIVSASGTLKGQGTVAGAVVLNGTIAPGLGVGTLSTGEQTWAGGASYNCEIQDAIAAVDLVQIQGALYVQATPGAQFHVALISLNLGGVVGDALDFNPALDYDWVIATATGGISGFTADAISIDTSTFSNPTAGGRFYVSVENVTNLVLHFEANRPPVASDDVVSRPRGVGIKIRKSDLLANDHDPESGLPQFAGVSPASTNGALLSVDATYVYYQPLGDSAAYDVADRFSYSVSDGFWTSTGQVLVNIAPDASNQVPNVVSYALAADGNLRVTFAGIPGRTYLVQAASELTQPIPWQTLTNNFDGGIQFTAAANGLFAHTDLNSTNFAIRFYRSILP